MVAVAVGSMVVSAASSVYSAKKQADSARKGMKAQERIAYDNREFQREMADQQRGDFAPWRDTGQQALDQIWSGVQSGEFEVGKVNVLDDPGYQFRMDQGRDALDSSAASRGRLLSGAQQKALTEYGQDYGSNEYSKAYSRQFNEKGRKYNILSGLNQTGQASAAGQAAASAQLGNTTANIMSNLGQSQQQGYQNMGNARASGYQDVARSVNQGAQNWMQYKALQQPNNTMAWNSGSGAAPNAMAGQISANNTRNTAAIG